MDTTQAPWYTSSVDPTALSHTIQGAILASAGVILFISHQAGIPLTNTDIGMAAANIGIAGGSLWFLFGLIRKIFMFVFGKTAT